MRAGTAPCDLALFETELSNISSIFSSLDFYLLKRCINKNVQAMERKAKQQHNKKLRDLTHNRELPFTANETVVNLSTYELTDSEKDLLKFGLKFGLPPSQRSSFEALNGFLTANRKAGVDTNEISAELSSLAQNYCSSYKPTRQTLKKHGILKKLRQNKNIVICKPDKGNSVVGLNRDDYDQGILDIIRDRKEFVRRQRISGKKNERLDYI